MSWPSPQDFAEAVQNPSTNFCDPDLQAATVQLDHLGLPVVCSGKFAAVFPAVSGSRTIAIKCFLSHYPDRQARYQAISSHLSRNRLPCLVNFQYIERGILVAGTWYPVLKMEWVDGQPFVAFLRERRGQRAAVAKFLRQWMKLAAQLFDAGIAHGDLQPDNVLVTENGPVLVDYDGMFVPTLEGRKSAELGVVHFQHPKRTENDFGLHVDNFAFALVYYSMVCLLEDEQLWELVDEDNKFLLLGGEDLKSPYTSDTFARLNSHENPSIVEAAGAIRSLLSTTVSEIPPLKALKLPSVSSDAQFDTLAATALGLETKGLTLEALQEAYAIWQYVWNKRDFPREMKSKVATKAEEIENAYSKLRAQLKAAQER